MVHQMACIATNKPEKYTQELCHSSKTCKLPILTFITTC